MKRNREAARKGVHGPLGCLVPVADVADPDDVLRKARVDLQELLYRADKYGDPEAYAHLERLLALTKPE